jgi:integrase
MDATKKLRIPKLSAHRATGQSFIRIAGRAIYFGKTGLPETSQKYHQFIAEWMASGCQFQGEPEHITIREVCARFWTYAEGYYIKPDGSHTSEIDCYRSAIKPLLELYGLSRAAEFGPKALKLVRQKMIKLGWHRNTINKHVGRIRTIFRWAGENELISGTVRHDLQTVAGLRVGRSEAKESEPVRPVKQGYVDAVKPFVSRHIWAIIQLQLLTGARPTEILMIRPCDIDQGGKIWIYKCGEHKTAHRGYERTIYIGPKAQEILRPFLARPHDAYCFSPAEAEAERRQAKHLSRKTPLKYGNTPGTNCSMTPKRSARSHYKVSSYRRTIERACNLAFVPPAHLRKRDVESSKQWQKRMGKEQLAELKVWQDNHKWHPHQLRHNDATYIRKEFGLDTARVILGHRSAAVTEVYAELDQQKAMEAIVKVG